MIKRVLLPLPQEGSPFAGMDLVTVAVYSLIASRYDLSEKSNYKVPGSFYDTDMGSVYCVYPYDELARQLGTSKKTIQRAAERLAQARLVVRWRGDGYNPAVRYNLSSAMLKAYYDGQDWQKHLRRWRYYWEKIASEEQRDKLR